MSQIPIQLQTEDNIVSLILRDGDHKIIIIRAVKTPDGKIVLGITGDTRVGLQRAALHSTITMDEFYNIEAKVI
jgi:hypothetical protein